MQNMITQLLSIDHQRLDYLFKMYLRHQNDNKPKAKQFFDKFREGLLRHIDWEETLLFPEFEQAANMVSAGPTFVMRDEHKQIKTFLDNIAGSLTNAVPLETQQQALIELLNLHNEKEEQVLYGKCDQLIKMELVGEILLKM